MADADERTVILAYHEATKHSRLLRLADDMAGQAAEDEGFAALAILAAHAVLESLVNQLGREEIPSLNEQSPVPP